MANDKTIHKSVVIIVFQYISVTVTHWKDESDFSYPILIIVLHLKSVTDGKNKTKNNNPMVCLRKINWTLQETHLIKQMKLWDTETFTAVSLYFHLTIFSCTETFMIRLYIVLLYSKYGKKNQSISDSCDCQTTNPHTVAAFVYRALFACFNNHFK